MKTIEQQPARMRGITMKDRAPSLKALSEFSIEDEGTVCGNAGHKPLGCDACQFCEDRCEDITCCECSAKQIKEVSQWPPCQTSRSVPYYTRCQVRRHNHEGSAWIVAGDNIYDVTESMHYHPGGTECLLRRAGGARDCTRDFEFHSQRARKQVNRLLIGKLRTCPCEVPTVRPSKDWWVFW
jgi:cytochrome b involved in lipid metabolism